MILEYPGGLQVITGPLKVEKGSRGEASTQEVLDYLLGCLFKTKDPALTSLVIWFLLLTSGSTLVVRD